MVCALSAPSDFETPLGDLHTSDEAPYAPRADERAEGKDPFDDFEEDDFDDDFDDDFEEDWEDDLTEDDEFPDTFGGADEPDEDEPVVPGADDEESPFADDPDFDEA
jgi:hypothetical protein